MTDFTALYQKYAAEVFRFALYLSGNQGDAEDITSETFVRVWTSAAHIDTSTVRGYLLAIARNLFLQGLRRSRKHGALSDSLPDAKPGPHERAQRRAELDAVLQRLQQLPELDRAAVLMRALEDAPYEDIARALGISVVAAKVKVHRARISLAQEEKLL
jgi:RNA polymerase sigma-70 factor (ECF subfamily)